MKKYILILVPVMVFFINTGSLTFNMFLYCLGILPLAYALGECTSEISEYIGERKGGLLAATTGNIPELMMGIWSIKYGMDAMVKSALMGSIISNMLLVLGISIFVGGVKFNEQKFNKFVARMNFNMLLLTVSSMMIVAALNKYSNVLTAATLSKISIQLALILIVVYVLGLIFSLYTHRNLFVISEQNSQPLKKKGKEYFILVVQMVVSVIVLYFASEKLIDSVRNIVACYKVSESFIGIILIPILGNVGENISAIMCAAKNKVNLSLEIAIGSSIQIALFVTPVLIIFSYFAGNQITYLFSTFQIIIGAIAIGMSYFVFQDGKTFWFEGVVLIAVYIVITVSYYYIA